MADSQTQPSFRDDNLAMLRGRAVRDAESIANGKGASFSIAVSGGGRNRQDPEDKTGFFDVVTFGEDRVPKVVAAVKKGKIITVAGRLQHSRWQADDGGNRSKIGIIAETVAVDDVDSAASATQETEADDGSDWPQF